MFAFVYKPAQKQTQQALRVIHACANTHTHACMNTLTQQACAQLHTHRNTWECLNAHTWRQTHQHECTSLQYEHTHTLTHPHYTGGPAWRRAKAPSLLSLVGGPDKSNNLTGKQAVMFGQTYLRKALTLLSLTQHTLLPPLSHRHRLQSVAFLLPTFLPASPSLYPHPSSV